jgi:hypothetical protein
MERRLSQISRPYLRWSACICGKFNIPVVSGITGGDKPRATCSGFVPQFVILQFSSRKPPQALKQCLTNYT